MKESLRQRGGVQRGRKTPTKFLEFMTQKDAFLRPFSPFLYSSDSRGGGGGSSPAKFFWSLWLKKIHFESLFTVFYVISDGRGGGVEIPPDGRGDRIG